MWKAPGNPVRMLSMLRMMEGATMVAGHMRYSTHGNPANNINNHPHPCDGGWIVHNGVVHNYRQLLSDYRLVMNSNCDSEVIGLLAEASAEATAMGRLLSAVEQTDGNLAVLGLWNRKRQLVAIRRGNPLHIAENERGYYMASLAAGMPVPAAEVKIVGDNTAVRFTQRGVMVDIEADTVRPMAAPARAKIAKGTAPAEAAKASLFEFSDDELDAMVRTTPAAPVSKGPPLAGGKLGSRPGGLAKYARPNNHRGVRANGEVDDTYRGG